MSLLKNKRIWSILLFIIPLAIGIPLAMYLIPSNKSDISKKTYGNNDNPIMTRDSVEIKLNIVMKELIQLNNKIKKLEENRIIDRDSLLNQFKLIGHEKRNNSHKSK